MTVKAVYIISNKDTLLPSLTHPLLTLTTTTHTDNHYSHTPSSYDRSELMFGAVIRFLEDLVQRGLGL